MPMLSWSSGTSMFRYQQKLSDGELPAESPTPGRMYSEASAPSNRRALGTTPLGGDALALLTAAGLHAALHRVARFSQEVPPSQLYCQGELALAALTV